MSTEAEPRLLTRIIIGRDPMRTLVRMAIWVVLLLAIWKFALVPVRIHGISMLPTYRESGFNVVNRLSYLFHEPRRGDVVAIRLPAGEHIMYLKRIIGLPGETVGFRGGRAMVNGKALEEPYVKLPCEWDLPAVRVGPDEYFVVGDNRSMPAVDHTFGRAPRNRIVGKALL